MSIERDGDPIVAVETDTRLEIPGVPRKEHLHQAFGRIAASARTQFSRLVMQVLDGVGSEFPEPLRVTEADAHPMSTDHRAATQQALDQSDVQTTFFINFTPHLDGVAQKQLQQSVESVQSWQAWSSSVCEAKVLDQINAKHLSNGNEGQFARSSYRAKVFDYLLHMAPWFQKTFDQNIEKEISCQKLDFHTEILKAVLARFSIPASVFNQLEAVLIKIGENISLGKQTNNEKHQYWIMFTRYDYQQITNMVQPVIRVITFSIDQELATYTSNKANCTSIDIVVKFGQYQADFSNKIYTKIRANLDNNLFEAGEKLMQQKTLDITI